jgi:hypothetical protein
VDDERGVHHRDAVGYTTLGLLVGHGNADSGAHFDADCGRVDAVAVDDNDGVYGHFLADDL